VVPGDKVPGDGANGAVFPEDWKQSEQDWSAVYAQFSISHAISYLTNHYDRGNESALLARIVTKKHMRCFVYMDGRLAQPRYDSAQKSAFLRESINSTTGKQLDDLKPLLQCVGEQFRAFVVLPDCDDNLECAIPHAVLSSEWFSFTAHAFFHRDPRNICRTSSVTACANGLHMAPIVLTKPQQDDVRELSALLESFIQPVELTWVLEHVKLIASEADRQDKTARQVTFDDSNLIIVTDPAESVGK